MTDVYACTTCKKKRAGRFTRLKSANTGGGWDQGRHLPHWYCYTCHPHGKGNDEVEESTMPAKATPSTEVIVTVSPVVAKSARAEGLGLIGPLESLVANLDVKTADDYLEADIVFGRIKTARKTWAERMERIIRPIRAGLDELYALNREVDKPLARMEESVELEMKGYKLNEQRRLRAAEEERLAEVERLRKIAEAKAEKELAARTKGMRERLAEARRVAETALAEAEQAPVEEAVRGMASTSRATKKVRILDIELFMQGLLTRMQDSSVSLTGLPVISINQVALNKAFKDDPEAVADWPGVDVYDDVQIVRR